MKKILLSLFALLACMVTAQAQTFTKENGITYNVIDWSSPGKVEVTKKESGSYKGDITIPSEVYYEDNTYKVTQIGYEAFKDCSGLTSISIPNTVTLLGDGAFTGCSKLAEITIPNSVTSIGWSTFSGCSKLTEIIIPNSVTSIGGSAFANCGKLASVTLCDQISSIEGNTFQNCTSLTSITIPDGVTIIRNGAFSGCEKLSSITIPNSVEKIEGSVFFNCSKLTSVDLSNITQTTIEGGTFQNCASLTSITIPDDVEVIDNWAFANCTNLTSINIPSNLTKIGEYAFSNCEKLASAIVLPNSVTTIGYWAFSSCKGLTSVDISACQLSTIEEGAFNSCESLKSITIPNGVEKIKNSAFQNCYALTSITIPNGVTEIGKEAFWNCNKLASITIPNDLEKIGQNAFWSCSSLTSITIPNTVEEIGSGAFDGCSKLTSIDLSGCQLTTIESNTFSGCSGLTTIVIPNTVDEIGSSAFQSCSKLTSIDISGCQLTAIESWTFAGCEKLSSITIPNSVEKIGNNAFDNCPSLTSITIPSSVEEIGERAFYCYNLKQVISEISDPFKVDAFDGSKQNAVLIVPKDKRDAYKGTEGWDFGFILEEGDNSYVLEKTEQGVDYKLRQADDNSIYYAVTGISDEQRTEIVIADKLEGYPVKAIEGWNLFQNCKSLTKITIPSSVTTINSNPFYNCMKLDDVYVVVIDSSEFCNNQILKTFENPVWDDNSNQKYFNLHLIDKDGNEITEYIIPEGVTTIGDGAFKGTALTSITIPNGVTSIGNRAFLNCKVLTEVTIPNGVKTIGNDAFNGCSALTKVTIPSSVTAIGNYAFSGCDNLQVVMSGIEEPFEVDAFNWYPQATLVVPENSVTAYQNTSGWNQFAYIIKEGESVGEKEKTKDGIKYSLRQAEDNSVYYAAIEITDVQKTEIVIPAKIDGCPVKAFEGWNFFQNCKSLTKITIPSSVTRIDGNPFYGCFNLKDVNVVVLDYAEFCNNAILGTFENPYWYYDGDTQESTEIKFTLHVTDSIGNEITDYIIPEGVKTIGKAAFKGYTALSSIAIPSSVEEIGDGAFYGCSGLIFVNSAITSPFDVKAFDKSADPLGLNTATLIVPKNSRPAYKGKNGWDFAYIYEDGELEHPREQTDDQGVCYTLRQDAKDYSFYYAVTGHTDALKTEIVIPAEIKECPVRAIEGYFDTWNYNGNGAFKDCSKLTSVKLGKNIRSIGDYAFYDCVSLSSITLPRSLESIGNSAFSASNPWDNGYVPITSISIPHKVKTIGNNAFSGCRELALVNFEVHEEDSTSITSIGDYAFQYCVLTSINIPNSVTSIGSGAFYGNGKLTTAILGTGITEIKDETFRDCYELTSVTIPDGVTSIAEGAFRWCGRLGAIKLPKSLTTMGNNVFQGCSQMKSIELPDAFTEIPTNLFKENDFAYIKLGNNVKSIGRNAFGSTLNDGKLEIVIETSTPTPPTIDAGAFPKELYLTAINVIVPNKEVQEAYRAADVWDKMTYANMGNYAEVTVNEKGKMSSDILAQCGYYPSEVVSLKVKGTIDAADFTQMRSNMKSLLILDLSECDITEIPDEALRGKTQLQEVILPNKLQTIGNYAFQGCPYLTGKLDIPAGVTSIGDWAFEGTYYTSVNLPTKLQTIGSYAFYNLPIKQKINLPDGLTSIGEYAFAETQISGHADVQDGIKTIGDGAFRNTLIEKASIDDNPNGINTISYALFQGCSKLDYIYIPRNITAISGHAFDGCTDLWAVHMSPNLEAMGEYAFQDTKLEYMKVPSKVSTLPWGVFKNCKSLESLALPADLESMSYEALMGCTALRNLTVEAAEPPTVENNSMLGVNTDQCVISIPTQSFEKYLNAQFWGQFVNLRNNIAVETEGNGEIAFESVVEEDDGISDARRASVRRYIAARARAKTRGAGDEEDDELKMTFASNGSSIYVPNNGKVRFYIIPAEAEVIQSATLDGVDITNDIKDNVYETTPDKKDGKLIVKFSGEGQTEPITIGKNGKTTYCGNKSLDFSYSNKVKAFIATGFDKAEGIIWMTRVKDVPAGVPVMIKGDPEVTYNVPVTDTQNSYYKNMFVGNPTSEKITINETSEDGKYENYYMSGGQFKSVNKTATIGAGKCYLQLPADFEPETTGDYLEVKIAASGKSSFAAPYDLDFTDFGDDLRAFTATGFDKSTSTIWLTRVKKVQKGEGLMLKGNGGETYYIPSMGVQAAYENMIVGNISGGDLIINETSDDGTLTNFYLKGGTYMSVKKSATIGNNKSYLQLPTSMLAGARSETATDAADEQSTYGFTELETESMSIVFGNIGDGDGETTGIQSMFDDSSSMGNDEWYTLGGQRISKPTKKGLYIHNGRKVVIK